VEVLADPNLRLDHRADFLEEANLRPSSTLSRSLSEPEMRQDEEHSSYAVIYRDGTHAERSWAWPRRRPEYRRFRAWPRHRPLQRPAFVAVKNDRRESQPNWLDLLNYVKAEGKRDASVQRYKGLGEMNAEQLAETTMNPKSVRS